MCFKKEKVEDLNRELESIPVEARHTYSVQHHPMAMDLHKQPGSSEIYFACSWFREASPL